MAFKKSIVFQCHASGCDRKAKFEVFDIKGKHNGYYCSPCADLNIRKLNRGEGLSTRKFRPTTEISER